MGLIWLLLFLAYFSALAYQRASLRVWTLAIAVFLILMTWLSHLSVFILISAWLVFFIIILPLHILNLRQKLISKPLLDFYLKSMPSMSRTEKEALAAGTVTWEGELFCGNPHWNQLLEQPRPQLTQAEQAFLDGPVDTLCRMLDDWDTTYNRADLSPTVWEFIKTQGFFALIIPKEYGGKQFSAYAHSKILAKIYGRSMTAGSTVSVPNSLGPAELLLHYGTAQQKNYYLPRLARAEEIPCFALTGPDAGSDAGAMTDKGIVCKGEHEGKQVLGIRLNFNKRYITLAPIATVIGLAFKLYDPEGLLGGKKELGITCALVPRNTAGITIGHRHLPTGAVFQNGPIQGKDVFIPVDWIIGGPAMAGHGWHMLMECLAAGRAISLPASALGAAKVYAFASGAYARIRRQFNVPIGRFEGIEEVLARIAGHTYIMDAASTLTAATIDLGEKPAVASAIIKYHVTELGRSVTCDAMDLHGGKGICLGPKNYIANGYQTVPIAITVEGANILTRSMIIFGQGAMRCHPYIYAEFEAAKLTDGKAQLAAFDKAIIGHISYIASNLVRSLVLSLTSGFTVQVPRGKTKRYFQYATRLSSAFALLADFSLIILGGEMKRKESISGRLGDILSYLYLLSAVLKQYHDQGKNAEDLPIVHWACQTCLYQAQQKFSEVLQNFPNRWVAYLLRMFIFPLGKNFKKPSDQLTHKVAQLLLSPTGSRYRLTHGAFLTPVKENVLGLLEDALIKVIAAEPIEKMVKIAKQNGLIKGDALTELAQAAFAKNIISEEQLTTLLQADEARHAVIEVDDFTPEELSRSNLKNKLDAYASSEPTD